MLAVFMLVCKHHCEIGALIQITEIYLDAKAVLCREKQHQRMHIYKETMHFLVITHWHGQCQQKFTVHWNRMYVWKEIINGSANEIRSVLPPQGRCCQSRTKIQWRTLTGDFKAWKHITEECVLEHWTCFISELFTIYLNISHIQNRYNSLCGVILFERERQRGRLKTVWNWVKYVLSAWSLSGFCRFLKLGQNKTNQKKNLDKIKIKKRTKSSETKQNKKKTDIRF